STGEWVGCAKMQAIATNTRAPAYDVECLQVVEVPHLHVARSRAPGRVPDLLLCLMAGLAAPFAYAFGVYRAAPWDLAPVLQEHVAVLSAANFVCILFACFTRGQLLQKIQKALTLNLALYGLLAFTVMA